MAFWSVRDYDDDYEPVCWLGSLPLHAATLLVILHVLTMVVTSIAGALGAPTYALAFSSKALLDHGAVWQLATYAFLNGPSIWFVIEMYLLFVFGREVERFLGRRSFLGLYALLLFAVPGLLTLVGLFLPTYFRGAGSLHFAVFVAFATIYPNVQVFGSILVKWVAFVLLGIYSLQAMLLHDLWWLLALWTQSAIAFGYVAHARGFELPDFTGGLRFESEPPTSEEVLQRIDPVLEKISKHGMGSLTARELLALQEARAELLRKAK